MSAINVGYDEQSATFSLDVVLPVEAGGMLTGLEPSVCIALAMILGRAGRSRGASWPTWVGDEGDSLEREVQRELRLGLGEEMDPHLLPRTEMPRDERIERLLSAVHDTRAELSRVLYLLGEV